MAGNVVTPRHYTAGGGSTEGRKLRYISVNQVDLPKSSENLAAVYSYSKECVFHGLVFEVNSDKISMQVEIDGESLFSEVVGGEIVPLAEGIQLRALNDLDISDSGLSDIQEHKNNKWSWFPKVPLKVDYSIIVKMKSSEDKSNRDFEGGLVVMEVL